MPADAAEIVRLAEALERGFGLDNELDVRCEVAFWEPGNGSTGVRANDAGTKVIYSFADATEKTYWAEEWTADRLGAAAALRARAAQHDREVG